MSIRCPFLLPLLYSLLLIGLSLGMGYLLLQHLWFCSLFVFLLLLLCISGLYHFYRQQTEALKRLIGAIRFNDYSLTFESKKNGGLSPSLASALEKALDSFRQRAFALEEDYHYYTTLLGTIDSGLIVLNREQGIEWCNQAALRELHLPALKQLSDLSRVRKDLPEVFLHLKTGETEVVRLEEAGQVRETALHTVQFRIKNKTLSLVSIKNIHSVLESHELEAWQKLIRVLTHEIMNSMAPIISLSETLLERDATPGEATGNPSVNRQALQAIHRRSKGLLEFVQNYRKLTRIPAPQPTSVPIRDLFTDLQKLFDKPHIHYHFTILPPDLRIQADRPQIEQILINLIRNAEEACRETPMPQIQVSAIEESGKVVISVQDNGPGIVPEALDKIFVPFYTTKPGGSGIGLSLCKQIMVLHQGNISVSSLPGKGACFRLEFRSGKQEIQRDKKSRP